MQSTKSQKLCFNIYKYIYINGAISKVESDFLSTFHTSILAANLCIQAAKHERGSARYYKYISAQCLYVNTVSCYYTKMFLRTTSLK